MVQLPSVIERYWYAFDWDVEALWALDLPARAFPMSRLEWMLDIPAFGFEGKPYCLTPRDVLRQPYRYADEYRRTHTASLLFPIEIIWFRRRWLILDGVHRMMRAHELGHDEIMARKHTRSSVIPLRAASVAAG
jgi:hypothetical protein